MMFFFNILCENAQERKIKRILENSEKKEEDNLCSQFFSTLSFEREKITFDKNEFRCIFDNCIKFTWTQKKHFLNPYRLVERINKLWLHTTIHVNLYQNLPILLTTNKRQKNKIKKFKFFSIQLICLKT